MKIFNFLKKRIELPNPKRNPLVALMGYEKTYGKPEPTDFNAQVNSYTSWAYACINRIAFNVAMAEFTVYKKGRPPVKIKEHPFYDLVEAINPHFNKFEMLFITSIYLELTGNAYWWVVRNNFGVPMELWYLPAHWVKVIPSKEKFIAGYLMTIPETNVQVPFDSSEVIHFKYPSPHSLFYGMSPLMGAMYGIDLNKHIKTWGINFFMNNAEPAGILQTEGSLGDDAYARLKTQWNAKHRGSENAGKIAILEQGLKYERTGSTIKDAQFSPMSRDIRDEILGIFGVPASKLGLVEDVNRANAEANDYTFQKDTIQPRNMIIQEKLNDKLMPMYDVKLIVKIENTVPLDKEFRLREKQANIASGFSSIDDEREKDGLDRYELPETKVPLIPFSLTPAGTPKSEPMETGIVSKDDTKDDTEDDEEKMIRKNYAKKGKWDMVVNLAKPLENLFEERMKRFFEAQRKDVMDRINKFREFKGIDGAQTKRLDAMIILDSAAQKLKMQVLTRPLIKEAYLAGLSIVNNELDTNFDTNAPTVARNIEHRIGFLADKVDDTTRSALSEAIIEGEKNGESVDSIAKRIERVFDYSEGTRSRTIAMTEVFGALNMGQHETYKQAGVKWQKWITARDENVRESHQSMEGQVVGIDEMFTSGMGGKMAYPSDRENGADASDTINCRCQAIAIHKKGD